MEDFLFNFIKNGTKENINFDPRTDEGFQNTINTLADVKKLLDSVNTSNDSFFTEIYFKYLDDIYKEALNLHNDAKKNNDKNYFELLDNTNKKIVTNAVQSYLKKYKNASKEIYESSEYILKDFAAFVMKKNEL